MIIMTVESLRETLNKFDEQTGDEKLDFVLLGFDNDEQLKIIR